MPGCTRSQGEQAAFDCKRCGRRTVVPTWSRYVGPQLCPRCYRFMANQLARPILDAYHQRKAGEPPAELPDW